MSFLYPKQGKPTLLIVLVALVSLTLIILDFRKKDSGKPNLHNNASKVILITIDGLRAGDLSCYGYETNASSGIDTFAKESLIFENAFSQSPRTVLSYISMLTSDYRLNFDYLKRPENSSAILNTKESLINILKKHKFMTAGFSNSPSVSHLLSYGKDFNFWYKSKQMSLILPKVHRWVLENQDKDFFLLLQLNELEKKDYKNNTDTMHYSYDQKLKYIDGYLNRFFDFLKAVNLWDNTLLIVTSAHGRELSQGAVIKVSDRLDDTSLHVPLIIKMPKSFGFLPRRIKKVAGLVDIVPTILSVLEIAGVNQIDGSDLIGLINNIDNKSERAIFASTNRATMVRTEDYKFILNKKFPQRSKLFDLKLNRRVKVNKKGIFNAKIEEMKALLENHLKEDLIYN
tara:strand:+ start:388 stop:1587 length:1200 start_codon:yes stop_codon:yes gene_type:complete